MTPTAVKSLRRTASKVLDKKEGEEDEVQVMKEVKGGEEKKDLRDGSGEGSNVRGGQYLAAADIRCKEVTSSNISI